VASGFARDTLPAMDQPAGYLHVGFILISHPNLIVIGIMLVLFAVGLVVPFPGHGAGNEPEKKS
jgi:hypothetical protein